MSLARAILERIAGSVGVQRAETRIAAMPTPDLVDWIEGGIVGVGRAYSDWLKGGRNEAIDSLQETEMGAAALLLAIEELVQRRYSGRL